MENSPFLRFKIALVGIITRLLQGHTIWALAGMIFRGSGDVRAVVVACVAEAVAKEVISSYGVDAIIQVLGCMRNAVAVMDEAVRDYNESGIKF